MTTATIDPTVIGFLKSRLARVLECEEDAIRTDARLIDLGVQSIDAVLLSGEVEDAFRIELDPATVFDHDTLESFAGEITRRLATK